MAVFERWFPSVQKTPLSKNVAGATDCAPGKLREEELLAILKFGVRQLFATKEGDSSGPVFDDDLDADYTFDDVSVILSRAETVDTNAENPTQVGQHPLSPRGWPEKG